MARLSQGGEMKSLFIFSVLTIGAGLRAQELPLQIELNSQQAYQLYEHLNVPVQADLEERRLVKRAGAVECSKVSFYPGDFEYTCSLNVSLDESGKLVP
ncbi:MAG: hypothetical protein EB078_02840 [Proteobacteria bacterium]|nr:hypothetical protein [Pseudomonadota bacterium]NDC23998.1 hypothetical protein [Pseudomonadota bacterium]NDD03820.1 hypothetical protein [Pseudomonadota bacterium]NDG26078.1 hypothetical protein [Pseudomonadota bacterium]